MMKRAFLSVTLVAYATTTLAQVHVQTIRGRFCTAAAPAGWTVAAENPTGSAFGADLTRSGGAAVASYLIFGVPAQMRSSPYYQQWYVTPERAVMAHLTQFGSKPMSCDRPAELLAGSGYMGMACQSTGAQRTGRLQSVWHGGRRLCRAGAHGGQPPRHVDSLWHRGNRGCPLRAVPGSLTAEPVEVGYAFSSQEREERTGGRGFRVQPLAGDGALSRYDNRRELLGQSEQRLERNGPARTGLLHQDW